MASTLSFRWAITPYSTWNNVTLSGTLGQWTDTNDNNTLKPAWTFNIPSYSGSQDVLFFDWAFEANSVPALIDQAAVANYVGFGYVEGGSNQNATMATTTSGKIGFSFGGNDSINAGATAQIVIKSSVAANMNPPAQIVRILSVGGYLMMAGGSLVSSSGEVSSGNSSVAITATQDGTNGVDRTTIGLSAEIVGFDYTTDLVIKKNGSNLVLDTDYTIYNKNLPASFGIDFTADSLTSSDVLVVIITKAGYSINGGTPLALTNNVPGANVTGMLFVGGGLANNTPQFKSFTSNAWANYNLNSDWNMIRKVVAQGASGYTLVDSISTNNTLGMIKSTGTTATMIMPAESGYSPWANSPAVSPNGIYAAMASVNISNTDNHKVSIWNNNTSLATDSSVLTETGSLVAAAIDNNGHYYAAIGNSGLSHYNGSAWSTMTNGPVGQINELFIHPITGDLYALSGSQFTINGSTSVFGAIFNGTSWSELPGAFSSYYITMDRTTGNLYALPWVNTTYVLKIFNGTSWTSIDVPVGFPYDGDPMTANNGNFYIPVFTPWVIPNGGGTADFVAKFDGTNWTAIPTWEAGAYVSGLAAS